MSPDKTSDKPSQAKKPEPRDIYAPPLWLKIIGPVAGALTAAGAAMKMISSEYYSKAKRSFGVREFHDLRNFIKDTFLEASLHHTDAGQQVLSMPDSAGKYSDIYTRKIDRFVTTLNTIPGTIVGDGIERLRQSGIEGLEALSQNRTGVEASKWKHKTFAVYSQERNNFFESLGVSTKGVKRFLQGSFERWPDIGHNARINIGFGAFFSAVAVMASLFMLNLNTRLRHELRDIHGKLGDISAGGDSPEHGPIREGALLPPKLPSSQIDVQDAQHDRMTARPEHARA